MGDVRRQASARGEGVGMSCKCKRCGSPNNDCDFAICYECFLDQAEDDLTRNMICGGKFYPSVKEVQDVKMDESEVDFGCVG